MVQEDIYNEDASFCVSEHFVLRFGTFRFADYRYLVFRTDASETWQQRIPQLSEAE